jgi:hypothetical protein
MLRQAHSFHISPVDVPSVILIDSARFVLAGEVHRKVESRILETLRSRPS